MESKHGEGRLVGVVWGHLPTSPSGTKESEMTRKDYVALAAALTEAHEDVESSTLLNDDYCKLNAHIGIDLAVDAIASVLAANNPAFDRRRFVAAVRSN